MTNYDTEFHLLCACHTLESTKKRQAKKKKRFTPPSHEMTEDLQIYIYFFLLCIVFVAGLFVGYIYFTVDLMCLVVNRMLVKTVLFCVSCWFLCHYLYLLHVHAMRLHASTRSFVRSFVPSFVCSFYGVGALVAVEY